VPDISVAPAAPIAPAAAVTASAAPVKDGAAAEADPFAGQLSAALQALGVTAEAAATTVDAKLALVAEAQPGEIKDELTDEMAAELLASLGIVPLPIAPTVPLVQLEHPEAASTGQTVVDAPAAALPLAETPLLGAVVPQAQPNESTKLAAPIADAPAQAELASGDAAPIEPTTAEVTAAVLPNQPELDIDPRALEALRTNSTAASAAPAVQPQQPTDPSDLPTQSDAQPAPSTASSVAPAVPMQSGFDSTAGGHDRGNSGEAPAAEAVSARGELQAPATVAAPRVAEPQAPQTSPTHVVSQIVQQADLYRLPGGRGVRIELNPEGLGGLQVTVRYAPTGEVELHMNIEHAATADLVRSGWTELRDALVVQGISADRLVMTVTSTSGGSLADSSGSGAGNGFRADGGQTSFGQPGQQRDAQSDSRGWNGRFDAAATPEEQQLTAATSRIDLRA
jgi:hypothetical protein